MPVSVNRDPFSGCLINRQDLSLRVPQARVLAALMPEQPDDHPVDWPIWTRGMLGVKAGYTAVSGTITRALNGIKAGSSSGEPYPGLIARKMVEEIILELDGVKETNYRITTTGIQAYQAYLSEQGKLPQVKDPNSCTNTERGYKRGEWEQGRDKYGRS